GPGEFPKPVAGLGSPSPLYRWTDVADWAANHLGPDRVEASHQEAKVIAAFNAALELRRYAPDDAESILDSVLVARK
ncbi:DNA-binding protein, partial [Singulisphaera rosea]